MTFALSTCISRIGCFLKGCCYGKKIEDNSIFFNVIQERFFHQSVIYYPTQLYFSFMNLCIFLLLLHLYSKRKRFRAGIITILYFYLYPILRFFIEKLRNDPHGYLYSISLFTALKSCLCVVFL